MAGVNKSLKAGSVVFKTGDDPDGMYVVRKGELIVYLEQENKEIILARIPEGGIVGEMSLFEKLPRSASVKAGVDSEITHISQADFTALMKQIPKWFVGLMGALSSRLRSTNDRLKNLEHPGQADRGGLLASRRPYLNTIRILHTIDLIILRDALKDGKDLSISRKTLEEQLIQVFGESPHRVQAVIDILCSETVFSSRLDGYKNATLALSNRANLTQFTQFLSILAKNNPHLTDIPEAVLNMFKLAAKMSSQSPYDSFTATLEELTAEAAAAGVDPAGFQQHIGTITIFGETAKSTKASGKSGLGLKVIKGEIQSLLRHVTIFSKIAEKRLD